MSIIIDTCTFSAIVNKDNVQHDDFIPVIKWVIEGKAKIIIGGNIFDREILRVTTFNNFLKLLSSFGKVYREDEKKIEDEITYIEALGLPSDFDDPHIMALFRVTKCKVFCTSDKRTFKYFNDNRIIEKRFKPKIYTNYRHRPNPGILRDEHLCEVCEPHFMLNPSIARRIMENM